MLHFKVFIVEFLTINTLTSSTITICEITTLNHKVRNNTMENGTLVVKRLTRLTNSLLTSTKSTEILDSLRNSLTKTIQWFLRKNDLQTHYNTTSLLTIDFNIEEYFVCNSRSFLLFYHENYQFFTGPLERASTAMKQREIARIAKAIWVYFMIKEEMTKRSEWQKSGRIRKWCVVLHKIHRMNKLDRKKRNRNEMNVKSEWC